MLHQIVKVCERMKEVANELSAIQRADPMYLPAKALFKELKSKSEVLIQNNDVSFKEYYSLLFGKGHIKRGIIQVIEEAQELFISPKISVAVLGANGGIGMATLRNIINYTGIFRKCVALTRSPKLFEPVGFFIDSEEIEAIRNSLNTSVDTETFEYHNQAAYSDMEIALWTVGKPRKQLFYDSGTCDPLPLPSRAELLHVNLKIVEDILKKEIGIEERSEIRESISDALHIFITNPVGPEIAGCFVENGIPKDHILAYGGELDSARARLVIKDVLNKHTGQSGGHKRCLDVEAYVIGEHNDNMIVLEGSQVIFEDKTVLTLSECVAEGILSAESVECIKERVKTKGGDNAKKKGGSVTDAAGFGLIRMLRDLLLGKTVIALAYRKNFCGGYSFTGGPVKLCHDRKKVIPVPLEDWTTMNRIVLTTSEKEQWRATLTRTAFKPLDAQES